MSLQILSKKFFWRCSVVRGLPFSILSKVIGKSEYFVICSAKNLFEVKCHYYFKNAIMYNTHKFKENVFLQF